MVEIMVVMEVGALIITLVEVLVLVLMEMLDRLEIREVRVVMV
tara:strand:- start:401 stop:529 length:129 start_codon:yes stop_codon:yes gene_type:complete